MKENPERKRWTRDLLRANQLDLLICALPKNVLMLSGYWPVIGTGVAIASAEGSVTLLIPEDEADLAQTGWADEVRTFRPGSLDKLSNAATTIQQPLKEAVSASSVRIGFEASEASEPATYSALHLYGGAMADLLAHVFPKATLIPADENLAQLRARKTTLELARLRIACQIAGQAFEEGSSSIAQGATEIEVATSFRHRLSLGILGRPSVVRADGFAWCMSGPNAALAAAAYARSRTRKIERGDLVLVHCNSCADGYWTDITRTFAVGAPDDRQLELRNAVFQSRQAALDSIRPGVTAAAVDNAARAVLNDRGFGSAFKHSTGHGVGFGAISAGALPRLHPASPDILEEGMVFNVEPAVYFENYGGIRHCDMVVVTSNGYELLTPFQCDLSDFSDD